MTHPLDAIQQHLEQAQILLLVAQALDPDLYVAGPAEYTLLGLVRQAHRREMARERNIEIAARLDAFEPAPRINPDRGRGDDDGVEYGHPDEELNDRLRGD